MSDQRFPHAKSVAVSLGYNAAPSIVHHWDKPTLLGTALATPPAIVESMKNERLRTAHYAALGRVAGAWAEFEALVDAWLATFAGLTSEIGVCFTGQMIGPRPRIDAFIALVRHLGAKPKWNDRLEKLSVCAQSLGEQRNRALHDVWDMREPSQPQRKEATARKIVKVLSFHEPTDKLLRLVQKIDAFRKKFDEEIAKPIFDERAGASRDTAP